eukprot:2569457-Lingulodinium_polyedra.AAC.1
MGARRLAPVATSAAAAATLALPFALALFARLSALGRGTGKGDAFASTLGKGPSLTLAVVHHAGAGDVAIHG